MKPPSVRLCSHDSAEAALINPTHRTMIGLGLALPLAQTRDSSPGGVEDVLLLASGTGGLLLAGGSGFLTLSS